ncbi:MAG: hypothetical protein LR008_03760 [Candidatus Pacebacteria bacterium]|nr:hypothetical protein [Candidatus Paceibacterota bacterium]
MRFFILAFLFLVAPTMVFADENRRIPTISCFSLEGLQAALNKITNEQQVLRNSYGHTINHRDFSKYGCTTLVVPSGSYARKYGFHQSKDFIFPVFDVWYENTNQHMYSIDGILTKNNWMVSNQCGQPVNSYKEECIVPVNCNGSESYRQYAGFLAGHPEDYIVVPRRCHLYTIR